MKIFVNASFSEVSQPGSTSVLFNNSFSSSVSTLRPWDRMRYMSYPIITTPPFLCHFCRALSRSGRAFNVATSVTWNTFLWIKVNTLTDQSFFNFIFTAYLDFFIFYVVLPFLELTDPVEDGIKRTHDQGCFEVQLWWEQHCMEERYHLRKKKTSEYKTMKLQQN